MSAGAAVLLVACRQAAPPGAEAQLAALRAEVQAMSETAAARFGDDAQLAGGEADAGDVVVGVRTVLLHEILAAAAAHYLDDVRLHLDLAAVVRAGDEVRVRVGPVNATAGRWDLAVTVQRIDAVLSAGTIRFTATDSNRIDLDVPVHVSNATGRALIDFRWNAARLASVVCSDFHVHEPFTGFVEPRTYRMRGYFTLVAEEGRLVARPVLRDRIFITPQPTPQSWNRVRELLREQDRIFRCGLALSPERMEAMLRDLLTRGFRFGLPASLLRPVPLPAALVNDVEVAGRRVAVTVTPEPPRLLPERLWLRAAVHARAMDDAPIRLPGSGGEKR